MMGSVSVNGVTITALTSLFTICVLARLDYGVAKVLPVGLDENARICGSEEFQCRDSKCIPNELLCDGRPDCKDNSDEEQSECSKPELLCPDYAFRCAYGACIDRDAVCNGVKDCFDNSDEELPKCPGVASSDKSHNGVCSAYQHRCDNGQCIDATALCDGQVDCKDGSDETFRVCGSFSCSHVTFRCNYGACIDAEKRCDSKHNCADGSDEDTALCGVHRMKRAIGPMTTERNITNHTTVESQLSQPSGCPGPAQPHNGQWKLHKSLCPDNVDCESPQGLLLDPGTQLVYSCNPGYKIRGIQDVFCNRLGKWSSKPVCSKITCPPLVHPSLLIESCWFHTKSVNCGVPVLPATYARISCATGYQKDTSDIERNENILCNDDGHWDPKPIRCIPVCGTTGSSGPAAPFVTNGEVANFIEFPWHATLYRQETKNGPKVFKCGATIIQPNMLITAAHCVYDEVLRIVQPATTFHVATGNLIQDFDSNFHDERVVRKRQVKNIYINCKYLGLNGNYSLDIALLELTEPFTLSNSLLPICMDFIGFDDTGVFESGVLGKVAGFGRTVTGESSHILQTVEVPVVSQSFCRNAGVRTVTQMYITDDKFCGGYANGSAVCDRDSGGGLVFKTSGQWYLRGIVSVGLGTDTYTGEKTCDSFAYTLFTKISKHITWINNVMLHVQSGRSYVPCYSPSNQ